MYNASNKFQAYTAASIVRRPKSKIEVGGVTYTGETALISYPKISHTAEKMIGGFPAKTCSFEIYNRSGELSLNGQEVTVYRGLEIDSSVEWVPMGIFAADDDNITNNLTKRSISFKGTDRSRVFDTQFVNDITYPCTVAQFVSHLCERHGISLETTAFPFSSRILLTTPNVDSSVSERELISRIAELGGCIAQISRTGGLQISAPQATGKTVKKRYYKTVSKEPKFGAITAVTLGRGGYSDDIIYPENANETSVNWRIEDNPFVDGAIAEVDGTTATTRETLIADIAANIIGRSIIPFSVADFVDDYIYDLNDAIIVEEKDGGTFETVILNLSTASRIKSNIGADTQSSGSTKYNLAGSVKQSLKKVLLEVNHQNNKISALVQDFSDLNKEVSTSLELMAGKIQGVVTQDDLSTTVTQLNTSWEVKFNDLGNPDSLENAATKITAEGVNIYNGKIAIYRGDSSSNKIIEIKSDDEGNAYLVGNIRANSLELPDGYIGTNMLTVGNIAKSVNNLFLNGDFSDDTYSWYNGWDWKNGAWALGDNKFESALMSNAYDLEISIPVGGFAMRLLVGTSTATYSNVICNQKITVTPGGKYTASFYVKRQSSSDNRKVRMCVNWYNSSDEYISSGYVDAVYSPSTAQSWLRFGSTVSAPSNASYALVKFYLYDETGASTFDDSYVYIAGLMFEMGSVMHNWDNGKILNNTIITEAGIFIYNGAFEIFDDSDKAIFSVNKDSSGNMYIAGDIQASSINANSCDIFFDEIKVGTIDGGASSATPHLGFMSASGAAGIVFGYWPSSGKDGIITVQIPNKATDPSAPSIIIDTDLQFGASPAYWTIKQESGYGLRFSYNGNNSDANSFSFDGKNAIFYAPNICGNIIDTTSLSANSVDVTSDVSVKANINKSESMLDKLRNAGIYRYNYISDIKSRFDKLGDVIEIKEADFDTSASTHYGLVIGEGYNTPSEVISSDGKHINLYSMISLAWKAIQELADKLDTFTATEVT